MDDEPELAAAVLAWWATRTPTRSPVRTALLGRHRQLWTDHARALLAAGEHLVAGDPHLAVYARTLQQGRLLAEWQLDTLARPPDQRRTRQRVQAAAVEAGVEEDRYRN
jgi:hypothetical protein